MYQRTEEKNMKNKIIEIFVCMLLITTMVPTVTSLTNSAINTTLQSTPLTSMAGSWSEEQKLLSSDGAAQDQFGYNIAIDGDTVLIGAWLDNDNGFDSGSAYVFTRTDATWTQQAKLIASDGALNDEFGFAVSLDGNTALIGAIGDDDNGVDSGSAYVFTRTGNNWTQQAKLIASDGAAGDIFGNNVFLVGDSAIIAAGMDDDNGNDSGSAYVFTRTGSTWTQQAKLLASDGAAGDWFGCAVSLAGDTALIGAPWHDDNRVDSGSAYVFTRTGNNWTQQAKLLASDGAAGDVFGYFVFLDVDTALIGAPGYDDNGYSSGSAYVFTRTGSNWIQQAKLLASDDAAGDSFGTSVALNGDTALIGAPFDDDNGYQSGSAYVFTRTGSNWTQQAKLIASDGAKGDQFGIYVFLTDDTALIGAYMDDDNGVNSGSAYVFTKGGIGIDIIGGLGINAVITNHGITNVTDVPWQIHVEGGILGRINKTVNGTVDIPVGGSTTVGTGMLFGLGPIIITVNVADNERIAKGKQFIIFSMVK
jgi:hypothetical protein